MAEDNKTLSIKLEMMQQESERRTDTFYKRFDKIDDKIEGIGKSMTDFILKVETEFITKKSASDRFASKLAERIVYAMSGTILTVVLGAILTLLLK